MKKWPWKKLRCVLAAGLLMAAPAVCLPMQNQLCPECECPTCDEWYDGILDDIGDLLDDVLDDE